jgi:hypothetical protein
MRSVDLKLRMNVIDRQYPGGEGIVKAAKAGVTPAVRLSPPDVSALVQGFAHGG